MKRLLGGLLFIAALAATGCAPMGSSASLQIRSAPPPPAFEFRGDPQFSYLSDRRVGVIADDSFGYDMFNSNGSYYLYSGGYWYRSQSAHGQFQVVDARRVPRGIFEVDDHQYRWRNHPEGWRGHRNGDSNSPRGGNDGSYGH